MTDQRISDARLAELIAWWGGDTQRALRELRDLRLKYQQLSHERDCLVEDVASRAAWQQRARWWMVHREDCNCHQMTDITGLRKRCDCGLDDFLKETP